MGTKYKISYNPFHTALLNTKYFWAILDYYQYQRNANKTSFTTLEVKPLFHVRDDSYFADQCNTHSKLLKSRFPVYCASHLISTTFKICHMDLRLLE